MMKIIEINCETGEQILRDATTEELAQAEADALEAKAKALAEAEVKAKRQALLERLGITEEEAKLLLS